MQMSSNLLPRGGGDSPLCEPLGSDPQLSRRRGTRLCVNPPVGLLFLWLGLTGIYTFRMLTLCFLWEREAVAIKWAGARGDWSSVVLFFSFHKWGKLLRWRVRGQGCQQLSAAQPGRPSDQTPPLEWAFLSEETASVFSGKTQQQAIRIWTEAS